MFGIAPVNLMVSAFEVPMIVSIEYRKSVVPKVSFSIS